MIQVIVRPRHSLRPKAVKSAEFSLGKKNASRADSLPVRCNDRGAELSAGGRSLSAFSPQIPAVKKKKEKSRIRRGQRRPYNNRRLALDSGSLNASMFQKRALHIFGPQRRNHVRGDFRDSNRAYGHLGKGQPFHLYIPTETMGWYRAGCSVCSLNCYVRLVRYTDPPAFPRRKRQRAPGRMFSHLKASH